MGVRIRRSAVARQERERPSPVNRRNASTAWCMIRSKYQTGAHAVKGVLPKLSRGAARRAQLTPRLEQDQREGHYGRDGEAVIGKDAQAVMGEVVEQEPGTRAEGDVVGHFEATGIRPQFCEELQAYGITLPADLFRPDRRLGT